MAWMNVFLFNSFFSFTQTNIPINKFKILQRKNINFSILFSLFTKVIRCNVSDIQLTNLSMIVVDVWNYCTSKKRRLFLGRLNSPECGLCFNYR